MRIARVFPRRTSYTPTDDLAFTGPPGLFPPEVDEVHVSVAFTWDLRRAEQLAMMWSVVAPIRMGGPATGMRGEEFTPGLYVKPGVTFTSRGCPGKCWFCDVWKRDGGIRELGIKDGWIVNDDNFLATGVWHQMKVFAMLKVQPERIQFTGGLDPLLLKYWQCVQLRRLRIDQMFFGADTPLKINAMKKAGAMLRDVGFTRRHMRAYVLVGWPGDSEEDATERCVEVLNAGFIPFAMVYRDRRGEKPASWVKFQNLWSRPAIIKRIAK